MAGYTTLVKTLDLKESEASYDVERSGAALAQEPMRVVYGEEVIGVLVPLEEYTAFRAWQESQEKQSPELLSSLEHEAEAFERMKAELLQQYRGRAVAILNGRIIEVGEPKESVAEVAGRVYERLGYVPVYVQRVEEKPRTYKITGPRQKTSEVYKTVCS